MSGVGGPQSVASGREQRVLAIIETARAKRARFREKQITLAHGAGGKATQTLIEGLLVPAFGGGESGTLSALGQCGAAQAANSKESPPTLIRKSEGAKYISGYSYRNAKARSRDPDLLQCA